MDEDLLRGSEAQQANDNPTLAPESGPPGSSLQDRKAFQLPENKTAQGALPVLELDFGADSAGGASAARGAGAEASAARKPGGDVRPPAAKVAAPELDHHPIAGLMGDALSKLIGEDSNSDATTRLKQIAEQTLKASDMEGGKFELITSRNSDGNHQIVLHDAQGNRAGMIARSGDFVAIDDGKELMLVSLNGNEADGTIKFDKDGKPIFGAVKDGEPIPFKSAQAYADLANDLIQLSQRYGPTGQSDITSQKKQDEKEQKALNPIAAHLLNAGDELAAVSRKMFGTEQPPNRDKLEIGFREFRSMNADDFVAKKAEAILDLPMQSMQDRRENGEIRQALADHYLATGQYEKAAPHFQHLVDYAEKPTADNYDEIEFRNNANAKKLEMTRRAAIGLSPSSDDLSSVIKQERSHFSSTDRFAPKEPEI